MTPRLGLAFIGVVIGAWALLFDRHDLATQGGGDTAGPWPWYVAAAGAAWVALGWWALRRRDAALMQAWLDGEGS